MNYIYTDDDFATEPTRGLPAQLPPGEHILWQGSPHWWAFAVDVYRIRGLALTLALVAIGRVLVSLSGGVPLGEALGQGSVIIASTIVGLAILLGLSWLVQRTSVYTITNRRVVLRVGVAIQKTFNIPFAQIDGAQLKTRRDGNGSICLALKPGVSIAYGLIWPHARPWRLRQTEPAMRGLLGAGKVAQILLSAFSRFHQAGNFDEGLQVGPNEVRRSMRAVSSASPSLSSAGAVDPNQLEPGEDDLASGVTASALQSDEGAPPKQLIKVAKLPVAMAFSLALFTLIFVGLHQLANPPSRANGPVVAPSFEADLAFRPSTGDRYVIVDVIHDIEVTTIEPGTDGLLRGALRGFSRTRAARGLESDAPYRLERYENDGTYLTDPLTDQDVRLDSFGPFDRGAVADLMAFGT